MIFNHLPNIRGLIVDMDGVLWQDTKPIGDLPTIFDRIREMSLNFILATNNATRTVSEYRQKLLGFGVEIEEWQVINSAQATGIYLQEHYPDGIKCYVIGEPSLKETIHNYGISIADEGENNVGVVVASLDYQLTYDKLRHAALLIQSGCAFIGTNPDNTLPTPVGFTPGSGTVIGALEIATGVKARIMGKPEPYLYQTALKRLGLNPADTLAIGDRLDTDIAGAQAAGIHTAVVLSGATSLEQAQTYHPEPDIIANNLAELIF